MKITIIGTGNVGGTLAEKWLAKGHDITLGVRDTNNFKGNALQGIESMQVTGIEESVQSAEVILVAIGAPYAVELCSQLKNVQGKIIIDVMNIVRGNGPEGYSNTAQALTDHTEGAHIVKCFNTTGFNNMKDATYGDVHLDLFMCGASSEAKETVASLARDAGFAECYDIGGEDQFDQMENFARFWINLAMFQGMGREIGFKLHRR
ncbi:NADPH-dependent F420 reductase [Sanyastnella coralliicola]|uniref:NADPH-dependent F420 reductase n=1 Tax=Sanyastnella coralliicola TaxID=3069118 RepID=UPI0027B98AA2|nr:NAD(P)-binding domain-containing protein [Longitalea sp. SCSIO 12813]